MGLALWPAAACEATRADRSESQPYPPIVFLWGQRSRVTQTAAADVYVVRGDGTGLRKVHAWRDLHRDGRVYGAYQAEWSPSGKQISLMLAWWCGDPCGRLARAPADGSPLRTVPVRADIRAADWSSDWRAVLTTFNADELWTVPMTGGKATRIWHSKRGQAGEAAWSPDGRGLAVTLGRGIVTMTAAGKHIEPLTRSNRDSAPLWSPDGRAVAFLRRGSIWIVDRNGHRLHALPSTFDAFWFAWSPDSRSILFTQARTSGEDEVLSIGLVRRDGGGARTLAPGPADAAAAWSPDGTKILFTREAARAQGGGDQLWVMNADGSDQTQLPVYRPRWSILSADWGS